MLAIIPCLAQTAVYSAEKGGYEVVRDQYGNPIAHNASPKGFDSDIRILSKEYREAKQAFGLAEYDLHRAQKDVLSAESAVEKDPEFGEIHKRALNDRLSRFTSYQNLYDHALERLKNAEQAYNKFIADRAKR